MSIRGTLRQRKKDLEKIAKNSDDKSVAIDCAIRTSEIDWVLNQMKKR